MKATVQLTKDMFEIVQNACINAIVKAAAKYNALCDVITLLIRSLTSLIFLPLQNMYLLCSCMHVNL